MTVHATPNREYCRDKTDKVRTNTMNKSAINVEMWKLKCEMLEKDIKEKNSIIRSWELKSEREMEVAKASEDYYAQKLKEGRLENENLTKERNEIYQLCELLQLENDMLRKALEG